ncbi:MAG: DUF935 family protein [Nitrospirae bacterium]|nr:MAG: DUF935 family protein [Nitrospirota bacterium]
MALLDQYGREIRSNKPITDEIAVQTIRDRYYSYPSAGLTPDRLALILREADNGDVFRQSELFEEMEEKDCHLGSELGKRKAAVTGLDWEVLPASTSTEDIKIAAAAKEMIEYMEEFDGALLDILDAVGKGFSVNEIMWDISEGHVWAKKIEWVHQKRFTFNSPDKLLKTPRLITDAEMVWGEELLPNKFIYFRHKARSGAASRSGLSRPCAFMYLFKNFDLKSWIIFNELYSVPMRVGKYPAGTGDKEKDALKRAVFNLGVDAAAVISDSTVIEFVESKSRGDVQAFEKLAAFCDRAMSKVIVGHTGSSESTAGRLGGEDEAKEVRQDLLEADAKALQSVIKSQLLAPWTLFNYGPKAGVPKFKLHFEEPEDLQTKATVYGTLVRDAGFKGIGEEHVYEAFGIPKPKAGERTLGSDFSSSSFGFSEKTAKPVSNKLKLMINTAGSHGGDSLDSEIADYLKKILPSLTAGRQDALQEIQSWLDGLDQPPTADELAQKIQITLGASFSAALDKKAISDSLAQLFAFHKLEDLVKPGIEIAFGGADVRTVDFLTKLDSYYMSKFIQNPDTVAALNTFIREQFLENGAGLFGNTPNSTIQAFKDLLDQKVGELTDSQVRRIIDTSVTRVSNWAHVSQLNDGGVKRLRIFEPTRDCAFCKEMNGKVIDVSTAYALMQDHINMSPDEYDAQFSAPENKPTIDNIGGLVNRGYLPPYHPHCRGVIVVA